MYPSVAGFVTTPERVVRHYLCGLPCAELKSVDKIDDKRLRSGLREFHVPFTKRREPVHDGCSNILPLPLGNATSPWGKTAPKRKIAVARPPGVYL